MMLYALDHECESGWATIMHSVTFDYYNFTGGIVKHRAALSVEGLRLLGIPRHAIVGELL